LSTRTEITPDIHLLALVSDKPGTLELRELSLTINTPDGIGVVVGLFALTRSSERPAQSTRDST
jgi:hypothetical protein